MKKQLLSIVAISAFASFAYAGKNVTPPPSEPVPVPVAAPVGVFLGLGLTYSHAECKCSELDLAQGVKYRPKFTSNTKGINLKAGYNFNNFFGLEAKYIYTPWGDEDRTLKHYGLYLKPQYEISKNVDVYALLGYGKTDCETLKKAEKGFAWGLGLNYTFKDREAKKKEGWGIYVEYLRPIKKSGRKDIKVDMVNAGIQYNF